LKEVTEKEAASWWFFIESILTQSSRGEVLSIIIFTSHHKTEIEKEGKNVKEGGGKEELRTHPAC